MKNRISNFLAASMIVLLACNMPTKNGTQWVEDKHFNKTVGNVSFIFPSKGYAYDNRNKLVQQCLQAIKSNVALLKLREYMHNNGNN